MLSFRLTKQTSKNVADTIFKLLPSFFWKNKIISKRSKSLIKVLGKKLSKCWAIPCGWTFAIGKLFKKNVNHTRYQCYHPKVIEHILKNKQKNKCVCTHQIIRFIIIKMKIKMKNRSHRYDIIVLNLGIKSISIWCYLYVLSNT